MNKPVLCPYCGTEMELDRSYKSILAPGVGRMFWYSCYPCGSVSPRCDSPEAAYAAAIQRAPERKPMTLREAQCFSECPCVLIDHKNGPLEWQRANFVIDRWAHPDAQMSRMYGKTWRAWNPLNGRPTDEERKKEGWK